MFLLFLIPAMKAHCDSLDGPVVKAAEKALAAKDLNGVLIWVQKGDEQEIKNAFKKTLAVRKLSVEAKELADRFFFETVVRVHRAGEGAAYTGLKPAGYKINPAIVAADKALLDGNVEAVVKLVTDEVARGVRTHFEHAIKQKHFEKSDVEAGREFVKAYVEYIHCVEALHAKATSGVHGHFPTEEDQVSGTRHEH
jgi:hypothetical protein